MNSIFGSAVRITNLGKYRYHIIVKDGSRLIDEQINGLELIDMLRKERLVEFTASDVLYFLEYGEWVLHSKLNWSQTGMSHSFQSCPSSSVRYHTDCYQRTATNFR